MTKVKRIGLFAAAFLATLLLLNNTDVLYSQSNYDQSGISSGSTFENPMQDSINVLTPNGGEEWETGDVVRIQWTSTDIDDVLIWLSINEGASWIKTLINNGVQLPASDNYFDWTVPDVVSLGYDLTTDRARIRILDATQDSTYDDSDENFSISLTPRLYTVTDYFSDVVTFYHQFNTTETFSAIQLQYKLYPKNANSWVVAQNSLTGDVTNITGSTAGTINWSTASEQLLSDYEGLVQVRIRFTSVEGSDFYLTVDPVGIDNLVPVYDSTKVVIEQTPYYTGFSKVGMKFDDPSATSGNYSFNVTLTDDFGYNQTQSTDSDTLTFSNLRTSTYYAATIEVIDVTGNQVTFSKHYKTGAFTDYNLDGAINHFDAGFIVLAITDQGHFMRYPESADLYPLNGTLPFVIQLVSDGIFSAQDFLQFGLMRNYYLDNSETLPKSFSGEKTMLPGIHVNEDGTFHIPLKQNKEDRIVCGRIVLDADVHFYLSEAAFMNADGHNIGSVIGYYDSLNHTAIYDFVDFQWEEAKSLTFSGRLENQEVGSIKNYDLQYSFDLLNSELESSYTAQGNLFVQGTQEMPSEYRLYQNYPNPFNPSTSIVYEIPRETDVTLTVYDVQGSEVVKLVNELQKAGRYEVKVKNAYALSSGIYFYTLSAGSFVETRKMILLK